MSVGRLAGTQLDHIRIDIKVEQLNNYQKLVKADEQVFVVLKHGKVSNKGLTSKPGTAKGDTLWWEEDPFSIIVNRANMGREKVVLSLVKEREGGRKQLGKKKLPIEKYVDSEEPITVDIVFKSPSSLILTMRVTVIALLDNSHMLAMPSSKSIIVKKVLEESELDTITSEPSSDCLLDSQAVEISIDEDISAPMPVPTEHITPVPTIDPTPALESKIKQLQKKVKALKRKQLPEEMVIDVPIGLLGRQDPLPIVEFIHNLSAYDTMIKILIAIELILFFFL